MTRSTSKTPIIVCCDSLQEQARLSGLLSKDYDNIMGCQLAQLETLMQREPSASVVVEPQGEARNDFDVFADMAEMLAPGGRDVYTEGTAGDDGFDL